LELCPDYHSRAVSARHQIESSMFIHTTFGLKCSFSGRSFCICVSLNVLFNSFDYFRATLTVFSLVLFMLVIEMNLEILIEWMLYAAILDAGFVFATIIFALTLQNCDALLAEYQQDQIVELPETIVVDPEVIEQEDGRKKQRSKSLLYSQLAVEDFMNGGLA
jgi:hypothetical protein